MKSLSAIAIAFVFSLLTVGTVHTSAQQLADMQVGAAWQPIHLAAASLARVTKVTPGQITLSTVNGIEGRLSATFLVEVTAGDRAINIIKNQNPMGFFDSANGHVTPSNQQTEVTNDGIAQSTGDYWVISAGKKSTFQIVSTVDVNQLFAGRYRAGMELLFAKDKKLTFANGRVYTTNSKTIVGERAPYITSIEYTGATDAWMTINGVRLNVGNPKPYFAGSPLSVNSLTVAADGKSMRFKPSTRLPNGVVFVKTTLGDSNGFFLNHVNPTPNPTTQATVSVVGDGRISLVGGSTDASEGSLSATMKVVVTTGTRALNLKKDQVGSVMFANSAGVMQTLNRRVTFTPVSGTVNSLGAYFTIPARSTATFEFGVTSPTTDFFAGTYRGIVFGVATKDKFIELSGGSAQTTNSVTIIGEKAPFLRGATVVNSTRVVTITGERLDRASNVYYGGVVITAPFTASQGGTVLTFPLPTGAVSAGVKVQSIFGESNQVFVNLTGNQVPDLRLNLTSVGLGTTLSGATAMEFNVTHTTGYEPAKISLEIPCSPNLWVTLPGMSGQLCGSKIQMEKVGETNYRLRVVEIKNSGTVTLTIDAAAHAYNRIEQVIATDRDAFTIEPVHNNPTQNAPAVSTKVITLDPGAVGYIAGSNLSGVDRLLLNGNQIGRVLSVNSAGTQAVINILPTDIGYGDAVLVHPTRGRSNSFKLNIRTNVVADPRVSIAEKTAVLSGSGADRIITATYKVHIVAGTKALHVSEATTNALKNITASAIVNINSVQQVSVTSSLPKTTSNGIAGYALAPSQGSDFTITIVYRVGQLPAANYGVTLGAIKVLIAPSTRLESLAVSALSPTVSVTSPTPVTSSVTAPKQGDQWKFSTEYIPKWIDETVDITSYKVVLRNSTETSVGTTGTRVVLAQVNPSLHAVQVQVKGVAETFVRGVLAAQPSAECSFYITVEAMKGTTVTKSFNSPNICFNGIVNP